MQSVLGSLEWKVETFKVTNKLYIKCLKVVLLSSVLCKCNRFRVIRVIPCAFKIVFQWYKWAFRDSETDGDEYSFKT